MSFLFLGRGEFRDHDFKRFGRDYLKKNNYEYLYLNINEISIINTTELLHKNYCDQA